MKLPQLNVLTTSEQVTAQFPGLDRNARSADGTMSDMLNLTSDDYPLLSSRPRRTLLDVLVKPNGLIAKDKLVWVDNRNLFYGGEDLTDHLIDAGVHLTDSEKQLVSMGAYIIILPDKAYINTQDYSDCGSIEADWVNEKDAAVNVCMEDGTAFDYTSGRCRAIGDATELEAALTQKRDELAQKQAEYAAIALAMESLQSANTALQNRFSPALSRRAGELFSRLTGGKYESVLLDRTFSAQAGETGESVSHDAQLLSLGTLDQLYLAVRLAICESALPADDPPPIVLDDALVRFDDERCRAALELLLEESKSRQILLFTCQHRESAYLSGRGGVTFLSL